MHFHIKLLSANKYLFEIRFEFTASSSSTVLQIPFWRPGRYEPGNFPRNYIDFACSDGIKAIAFRKMSAHQWTLDTQANQNVLVTYRLNADEVSAGNTYCDSSCALINPVNSLLYILGAESAGYTLHVELPQGWSTATSMRSVPSASSTPGTHTFIAANVQELMDSPILASGDMRNYTYLSDNINFHIHMVGYTPPNGTDIISDFKAITDTQIAFFGSFPYAEFRFLLLFMPESIRHGVEHEQSTVIVMGPSAKMNTLEMYRSLLSITSHELYHCWNVKYIRPEAWNPYDFTRSSPAREAYIAEGITTYMGEWMLWQAGLFDDDTYLASLSKLWSTHKNNEGRKHISLGDAAIDTWTDGYGGGAPERRVSIYNEGALLAFVCDALLVNESKGSKGLWSAMKGFYQRTVPSKGYREDDFWAALQRESGKIDWAAVRMAAVDQKNQLEDLVLQAATSMGLSTEQATKSTDTWWGARQVPQGADAHAVTVAAIAAGSPAETAGLWYGDIIETIDGLPAREWLDQASDTVLRTLKVTLVVRKRLRKRMLTLQPDGQEHAWDHSFVLLNPPVSGGNFEKWRHAADNL